MYSSSSLTLFLKYFYPIIFGTSLVLVLFDSELTSKQFIFLSLLIGLLTLLYIRTFGKLRKVKALHDQLVTDTTSYEETIDYGNIIYIYQIALFNPIMIGIKYIEEETGEHKKFYTLASWSNQLFSYNFHGINEVELTEFIRKKAKRANANYDEANEPSRWAPSGYLILTSLIGFLIGTLLEI